ncbi:hypothetical protein BKA62DRAFT_787644, partial [Auriculariales sp. MPI-PUGE-AT-0066]
MVHGLGWRAPTAPNRTPSTHGLWCPSDFALLHFTPISPRHRFHRFLFCASGLTRASNHADHILVTPTKATKVSTQTKAHRMLITSVLNFLPCRATLGPCCKPSMPHLLRFKRQWMTSEPTGPPSQVSSPSPLQLPLPSLLTPSPLRSPSPVLEETLLPTSNPTASVSLPLHEMDGRIFWELNNIVNELSNLTNIDPRSTEGFASAKTRLSKVEENLEAIQAKQTALNQHLDELELELINLLRQTEHAQASAPVPAAILSTIAAPPLSLALAPPTGIQPARAPPQSLQLRSASSPPRDGAKQTAGTNRLDCVQALLTAPSSIVAKPRGLSRGNERCVNPPTNGTGQNHAEASEEVTDSDVPAVPVPRTHRRQRQRKANVEVAPIADEDISVGGPVAKRALSKHVERNDGESSLEINEVPVASSEPSHVGNENGTGAGLLGTLKVP